MTCTFQVFFSHFSETWEVREVPFYDEDGCANPGYCTLQEAIDRSIELSINDPKNAKEGRI